MGPESDQLSDQDCWRAASSGQAEAFGTLFNRHADVVYRQCLWRIGSVADAEDLTSMTFLEAWRKRSQARFVDGSVRPWLLVIAANLARNHARASRRYHKHLARLAREVPLPAADAEQEALTHIDRNTQVDAVASALATLSRTDQEIISLCDLAGLTYAEAAAVLGVPVGTVRSRLSRARDRLRAVLGPSNPHLTLSEGRTS